MQVNNHGNKDLANPDNKAEYEYILFDKNFKKLFSLSYNPPLPHQSRAERERYLNQTRKEKRNCY